jgi:Cu(I)/Ag(I) efflux system membrane fusion protein
LLGALADYESVRARLAADSTEDVAEHAKAIAEWLRRAGAAGGAPGPVAETLLSTGAAAERLALSKSLAAARVAFADVSRGMIALVAIDPKLGRDRHVFECSMTEGFNQWIQQSAEIANPYQGAQMLSCGNPAKAEAPTTASGAVSHEGHGHAGGDTAYYTCSMHPSVRRDGPGPCPICGMDLTPVTFDEEEGGVIFVDVVRRQRIGVRIGTVERAPMVKHIRTVGKLTYDETKLHDVTLKYKGWIEKLHADSLGMRVKRGAPLFAVYSPELYAAQGDLVTALEAPTLRRDGKSSKSDGEGPFVRMARERLHLLDAYGVENHLKKTGKPARYMTVTSPATGYIVEKNVVEGSAFAAGARIMRIAGLDTVWIEAELYEGELPLVQVGQSARVTLTHLPDKHFDGEVTYLYPYVDPKTRTAKARIELDNRELELKPDMYANVSLEIDLGERLSVPESAVIYTGTRRLVFVDIGEGRLQPRVVRLGIRAADRYEVLDGINAGDEVVTSGNFLIASESRIRSAARYWGAEDTSAAAEAKP